MTIYFKIRHIAFLLSLISLPSLAYQPELNSPVDPQSTLEENMVHDFHLKNALLKLQNNQLAYAWGDLSYIVCQTPNHIQALKHMIEIAPHINKSAELEGYFAKALSMFPDDAELKSLYATIKESKQQDSNA